MKPTIATFAAFQNPASSARSLPGAAAWADTVLGPADGWSSTLRTIVHLVLDATLPMFLIWGASRTLVYNLPFADIAGDRHPLAFGKGIDAAWPELWRWDENVFDTEYRGAIVSFQDQHLVTAGDDKWFDLFYTPVRDDDGAVRGVLCNLVETTRRVRTEQASLERLAIEERRRIAHEAGGIGTFEWFPDTGRVIGSDTYCVLWGFAAGTALDASLLKSVVDPADHHLLGSAYDTNRINPLAYAEFRIRRRDTGETRWLARRGEVIVDEASGIRRYVGVVFDITERKTVEEALIATERKVHESKEFIRLLLDSTEEGFYSISREGKTTLCNRGFLTMLGFRSEADALGLKLHDVIHHSHADGSRYPIEQCPIFLAAQTGEAAYVEHEWFHRVDGTRFPVEYRVHPIWRDGQLQGALCTFIDITQRVASVDQLRILNETLEHRVIEEIDRRARAEEALHQSQKMEAIGQLTGGVAHDFNNVLQIIGGNLQLLQNRFSDDPEARKRLETASAAVGRGAKLASQLLAFARRQPLQPVVVNLGRVVQNMNDLLRRALGESVQVETLIADDLWNTMADPSQIENVILNLAINSRDAMNGEGRLDIELGNITFEEQFSFPDDGGDAGTIGDYVVLAVSDNGTGMSPEILKKAFEPFFTTKPEGTGTGLGLSMAYGFVKQSNGHIAIDSKPDHGTTIRIYLPRSTESEVLVIPVPAGPVEGGSETILVVEDDPGVQATVVDTLATLGYRVLKADNGEGALLILKSGVPVDLLFTDVVMPGRVRSTDLAREARLLLPGLAVLFTSGYTKDAIVHGGRLDPGVDLLSKPYLRDQLARKVRSILDSMRATALPTPSTLPTPSSPPTHAMTEPSHEIQSQIRQAPETASTTDAGAGEKATVAEAMASAPQTSDSAMPTAGDHSGGLHILVVEDNPDLCQLVCELLDNFGHMPTPVGSAEAALLHLGKDTRIDVLLTDIRLPGISGIDLARRVIAARPGTAIIFASGYGAGLAANVGFHAHSLAKPYDIDQLQILLQSLQK